MKLKIDFYSLYSRLPVPVKASIWYLLCSVLQKAIGFLTTPIFTRIMSTDEFGIIAVYNSWDSILTIVATLYLYNGVYNNAMIEFKDDRDGYTSSMQSLTTVLTIVLFIIYFIFREYLRELIGLSDFLMTLMFVDILFTAAMSFWCIRNRYDFKYINVIVFTVMSSIFAPIISLLLILNTDSYKAEARVFGMVAVHGVLYSLIYFFNLKRGKKIFDSHYWKYSVAFNLPLIPHYLSSTVFAQSDKVMINNMCSTALSGIYSIANNVSSIMNIVTISINQAITPWMYEKLEKREMKVIGHIVYLIMMIVGVLFLCITFFVPEIIKVLAPEEYYEAVWAAPPLLMGAYLYFIYCYFGNIEIFFHRQKDMLFSSISVALINVILNFVLIKHFGFLSASYATLISYYIYALFHYLFMKRICNEKKVENPFNGVKLFGTASIFIVLSLMTMMLFKTTLIRYSIVLLLILITVALLAKNKEVLKKILLSRDFKE
jgi:O-antigen/teichoic acid export membrane protein